MIRTPAHPDKHAKRRGATLVELLSAMAILSVLALVLSTMLGSALAHFRDSTEAAARRADTEVATAWIGRDLAAHLSSRPAHLPRLPEGANAVQRAFFEGRLFLPFEVNRVSGTGGGGGTFPNAAPGFGTLAFATRTGGEEPDPRETPPGIAGYYVAYARHSPLAGEEGAGMKLFRHFRPGGHAHGEGYADGLLLHATREINDDFSGETRPLGAPNAAAVRRARFENSAFPFLISRREDPGAPQSLRDAVAPWPARPPAGRLAAPPRSLQPLRGTAADWEDPDSPVHDSVFPDEAICDHVVRFELIPYRLDASIGGSGALMDAGALNEHLGLGGGSEWPALVAPDVIELVLGTVDETTARRLVRYEDWLIDWDRVESPAATAADRALLAATRLTRHRFLLPTRSP